MITVEIYETRYPVPEENDDDYCHEAEGKLYNTLEYTFRDLVYLLKHEFPHVSQSHGPVTQFTWATSETETDWGTNEYVEHSIHLVGNPRYRKYWSKAFKLSGKIK